MSDNERTTGAPTHGIGAAENVIKMVIKHTTANGGSLPQAANTFRILAVGKSPDIQELYNSVADKLDPPQDS